MSEGEVQRLSQAIKDLSEKTDRQHEDNQKQSAKDRAIFADAMNKQRELFQEALNKQFLEHMELKNDVTRGNTMLTQCVGDGQRKGRIDKLEDAVETLKQFRWQALAVVTSLLLLVDKADKIAALLK